MPFRANKPARRRRDDVKDPADRTMLLEQDVDEMHRHVDAIWQEAANHARRLKREVLRALDRELQDAAAAGARAQSAATDAVLVALGRARNAAAAIEFDDAEDAFVDTRAPRGGPKEP